MSRRVKNLFAVQKGTLAIVCIIGVLSLLLSSCEKTNGGTAEYENDILYGRWLLWTVAPFDPGPGVILMLADLRSQNIIFEFKPNNALTISSSSGNNTYGRFEVGRHFYEVTHTNISNGFIVTSLPQHTVEINGLPHGFTIGTDSEGVTLFLACDGECNTRYIFVKK